MYFQQGDILIFKIDKLPDGLKRVKDERGAVLAEGEATGHAHVINYGAEVYEPPKKNRLYLRVVVDNTALKHEEHNPIDIPAGDYEVRKVSEWDHFEEERRSVVD